MTLSETGRVGFAFGGSEKDRTSTALCLDMSRGNIHYEGYEILDLENYDPTAFTRFNFTKSDTHHIKLVCENEIVVFYIDGIKALSCRIAHSTQGAHIGVFAESASADFENIRMWIPG